MPSSKHETVFAQHQPVARLSNREARERVHIDAVEENAGVAALDVDFPERGNVADAGRGAHRAGFAAYAFEPILLAGLREPTRPQPLPGLDHGRAVVERPLMSRRLARRLEMRADVWAGEGADRDRHMRRTEARGAGCGDALARQMRQQRMAVEARGLALLGRHAERGVTLQMLDGAEAFPVGDLDVLRGHIVLQIDEGFVARLLDPPERFDADGFVARLRRRPRNRLREAEIRSRRVAARGALAETIGEFEMPGRRAGDDHARRQIARHEGADRIRPARRSVEMRGEPDLRIEATRDGERIDAETDRTAVLHDIDPPHACGAHYICNDRIEKNARAGACDRPAQLVRDSGTRIDDHLDGNVGAQQILGRFPAVIGAREHRDGADRRDGETVDIAAQRRGEQHARPIIAAEHDRALDRAHGIDATPRHDLPEPLARLMFGWARQMIGHAFDRAVGAAVIDAEHTGAAQDPDFGQRRQFGFGTIGP